LDKLNAFIIDVNLLRKMNSFVATDSNHEKYDFLFKNLLEHIKASEEAFLTFGIFAQNTDQIQV
jgi:hypothetical protein